MVVRGGVPPRGRGVHVGRRRGKENSSFSLAARSPRRHPPLPRPCVCAWENTRKDKSPRGYPPSIREVSGWRVILDAAFDSEVSGWRQEGKAFCATLGRGEGKAWLRFGKNQRLQLEDKKNSPIGCYAIFRMFPPFDSEISGWGGFGRKRISGCYAIRKKRQEVTGLRFGNQRMAGDSYAPLRFGN